MALLWQMTGICLKKKKKVVGGQVTLFVGSFSLSVQWFQCSVSRWESSRSSSRSVVFFVRGAVFLFIPRTAPTGQFQIARRRLLDRLISLKLQVRGEELGVFRVGRGKGLKFT